jgi:Pentapeptide repeats (8 copies)
LQGASLVEAQLQGALLDRAQLQRASLDRAQLQRASLDRAQLQGASLVEAQLQGASLVGALLQGVSLDAAQLQGASFFTPLLLAAWAQLQGASLVGTQLQGASLSRAQLQGASLYHVSVWRMGPPGPGSVEDARIVSPVPDAKYFGSQCEEDKCDWTREYYEALKAKIEAVPAGLLRRAALERIEPLGREPFTVDEEAAKGWERLAKASEASVASYPARLVEILIKTGCDAPGAPYVIRGLLRQLEPVMTTRGFRNRAAVAKAFLDPGCEGARGLSDDEKAELRRLAGPPAKERGKAQRHVAHASRRRFSRSPHPVLFSNE